MGQQHPHTTRGVEGGYDTFLSCCPKHDFTLLCPVLVLPAHNKCIVGRSGQEDKQGGHTQEVVVNEFSSAFYLRQKCLQLLLELCVWVGAINGAPATKTLFILCVLRLRPWSYNGGEGGGHCGSQRSPLTDELKLRVQ